MILFWIALVLALVTLDQLHRFALRTVVLKHQFALFQLRDDLREAAMRDEINPKNWVFLYLDSSITKTIGVLGEVTLWRALMMIALYRRDHRFLRAHAHLMRELAKAQNEKLANIHQAYALAIGRFFFDRHLFLRFVLGLIFSPLIAGLAVVQLMNKSWKRALEYQTEIPETSTLCEHQAV